MASAQGALAHGQPSIVCWQDTVHIRGSMLIYHGFPEQPLEQPVYLTIGNFDGVHRGHQHLIARLVAAAHNQGCLAGLLTFDPHPLAVLQPDIPLQHLTTLAERSEILETLGLDFLLILPFTGEVAATSAADFMASLVARLRLVSLWIGPDFALGRGREGDADYLQRLGADLGYTLQVVPPFNWQGEPVRSSRIRTLLGGEGAVARASELLGRPYQVWGRVDTGVGRGRQLGFPTANLTLPAGRLMPAFGVYACWAWHEERGYPAVVNVGVRPSFEPGPPIVEAYLLDFEGDLYGETVGLSFIQRLRAEKRFPNPAMLADQIRADSQAARQILANPPDHAAAMGERFWEEIRHTADCAMRVTGADQRQLFARAAAGMFRLQDANPCRPISIARSVRALADNPAELLVAWLNALLLAQDVAGELYTRFEIYEISARGIRGVAYGYPGSPTHTMIKAATYYDLNVEETPAGWSATVTFDI